MTTERRGYPRYDLMAQIRVVDDDETYILDVDNISMTGIFIFSENVEELPWAKLGQKVEMDIFTTNELENVQVQGLIVRISKKNSGAQSGFGASFTSIEKTSRERLRRLVEQAEERTISPPAIP